MITISSEILQYPNFEHSSSPTHVCYSESNKQMILANFGRSKKIVVNFVLKFTHILIDLCVQIQYK